MNDEMRRFYTNMGSVFANCTMSIGFFFNQILPSLTLLQMKKRGGPEERAHFCQHYVGINC